MGFSLEVGAIIAFVESTGLPYRVTSTYRPGDDGRHGRAGTDGDGLAVDLAGPSANDIAAMLAIYRAFLGQAHLLHELIFWAQGVDVLVRRRVKVVPMTYGNKTLAAHRDHVHISVDRGTFLAPLEVPMPDDPNIPNLTDIKFFEVLTDPATGKPIGYYMVSSTGEVHGHGAAQYFGRSEVVGNP